MRPHPRLVGPPVTSLGVYDDLFQDIEAGRLGHPSQQADALRSLRDVVVHELRGPGRRGTRRSDVGETDPQGLFVYHDALKRDTPTDERNATHGVEPDDGRVSPENRDGARCIEG